MSLAAGRQEYQRQHRRGEPGEIDNVGTLKYWSTSGSLDREQRADLAAEHTARTDPTGTQARDNLAAQLTNVSHAHAERRQRAALRQLGYRI